MPFGTFDGIREITGINGYQPASEQPTEVRFEMADGIAVVMTTVPKAGTILPQHSHKYPHISVIASGSVGVWKDGVHIGEFAAKDYLVIEANAKHLFVTRTNDTTTLCIHNVSRHGEIEMIEEHQIVDGPAT